MRRSRLGDPQSRRNRGLNRFVGITQQGPDDFHHGDDYLGIARSDDPAMIQAKVNNTRTEARELAICARIGQRPDRNPGLRREDLLISLVELAKENWSLGVGQAQYA